MTAALGEHVREAGADRQRGAEDVGQDHLAPELGGLFQEPPSGAEAGVGEHGVEPAEALEGGAYGALVVGHLGHVADRGEGAVRAAELSGELDQLVLPAGGQNEPVAGLRGGAGSRRADPRRGSGDQQNWVLR